MQLLLWKPRKRITDLFHCRSWARHPRILVCSVKLFTIHQFTALLHARHAEDDKELDAAATECRKMKRPKHQPFARLPHPEASGTITIVPRSLLPHTGHWPHSRSSSSYRYESWSTSLWTIISGSGSVLLYSSSSTVFAVPEHGPVKGKPPLQVNTGTSKGPSKSSKGVASPPAPDTPFFTVPKRSRCGPQSFFFPCIAERARDIVGQLLEIRNEMKP